uniref:Uncharacterized protein n=1 Tax=Cebus imitator TaxID=2715852 RepID=A0A2K5QQH8_CEBIM
MSPGTLPVQSINNAMFLLKTLSLSFIAQSNLQTTSECRTVSSTTDLSEKRHFGLKKSKKIM